MQEATVVKLFFNFRSPYCYLASKFMFDIFDDYNVNLEWRPLGGWDGRSPPEIAKTKLPLARQDVSRWTRRFGIPYNPPPMTTEPTAAGAGSLYAEKKGILQEYTKEVMRTEWADGQDIGDSDVLISIAQNLGLDRDEFANEITSKNNLQQLEKNWQEAQTLGVIGVPSFIIGEEIFWGNDRIDFVRDYLTELRLRKL